MITSHVYYVTYCNCYMREKEIKKEKERCKVKWSQGNGGLLAQTAVLQTESDGCASSGGVSLAVKYLSGWPFAARTLPLKIWIDWRQVVKNKWKKAFPYCQSTGQEEVSIQIKRYYLINNEDRHTGRQILKVNRFEKEPEMAAPPSHGTWNV